MSEAPTLYDHVTPRELRRDFLSGVCTGILVQLQGKPDGLPVRFFATPLGIVAMAELVRSRRIRITNGADACVVLAEGEADHA